MYDPIPVDTLPDAARQVVECLAPAWGCDSAAVAMPMLAVVAGAIGGSHRIKLDGGWSEPAILWVVVVGDGHRPVYETIKAPVHQRHAWLLRECERAKKRHNILEGRGAPPRLEYAYTSSTDTPLIARILKDTPRGTMLLRDDLGLLIGLFGGGVHDATTIAPVWQAIHRGEPFRLPQNGRDPQVHHTCMSIMGIVRPGALSAMFSRRFVENGMAGRFVVVAPPEPQRRPPGEPDLDGDQPATKPNAVAATLPPLDPDLAAAGSQAWLDMSKAVYAACPPREAPTSLTLSPEAGRIFDGLCISASRERRQLGKGVLSAWCDIEPLAARLTLVLHVLDAVCQKVDIAAEIPEATCSKGIRLAGWCSAETMRICREWLSGDAAA